MTGIVTIFQLIGSLDETFYLMAFLYPDGPLKPGNPWFLMLTQTIKRKGENILIFSPFYMVCRIEIASFTIQWITSIIIQLDIEDPPFSR